MPSANHYCYQFDWGFATYHVDEFVPEEGTYLERWPVNEEKAAIINAFGEVDVDENGKLIVTPVDVPDPPGAGQ